MIVSVTIPCRNEEKHIEQCIRCIYNSKLANGIALEVFVVDGISDDRTVEIVEGLKTEFPSLEVVPNKEQFTPFAFNLGIKQAKGDFIQIIGARQLISDNYIQEGVDTLKNNSDIWCVGGAVENVYQTKESEMIGRAMASPFGVGAGNFRIVQESTYTDTVGTPMYPAFVFEKVGLFDETLVRNQDDEFNYRVLKAGGKVFLNVNMLIRYFVRAKKKNLGKQYYQYGYWKVFVNKKHKTVTTLRQLIPLFFVLGLSLTCILGIIFPWFLLLTAFGVVLYSIAALYFAGKVSGKSAEILSIAGIFPILHFSYGFGYLAGIIEFLILNKKPSTRSKELSRK